MPSPEDIEQQQKLLAAHRRTLAHLLAQQAQFSAGHVPAHLANGIGEARANIQRSLRILRDWGERVENLPDDAEVFTDPRVYNTREHSPDQGSRRQPQPVVTWMNNRTFLFGATLVGVLFIVLLILWRAATPIATLPPPTPMGEVQPSTVPTSSDQARSPTSLPAELRATSRPRQDGQPGLVCTAPLIDQHTRAITFSPDSTKLASAGENKIIYLWNAPKCDGSPPAPFPEQKDKITSITWFSDSEMLASGSDDGTVHIWNVDTYSETTFFSQEKQGKTDYVLSVAWEPKGNRLASTGQDGQVIVATIRDGKVEGELVPVDIGNIGFSVAWDPISGSRLAVGSAGSFSIIDTKTNIPKPTRLPDDSVEIPDLAWSPNGQCLAAAGGDKIYIWPVDHWENRRELQGDSNIIDVAWSPNGRWLASAAFNKPTVIWDIATDQRLPVELSIADDYPQRVAWSSDGKLFATASDNKIRIWDVSGIKTTVPAHSIAVTQANGETNDCINTAP